MKLLCLLKHRWSRWSPCEGPWWLVPFSEWRACLRCGKKEVR